ncbi:N-acetyltransferase [Clostridium botulinum]|uniref:GNAT family N-acetyltransferase n=2 Tax=Clostridium botulinum TaxID=1491 RepID=UPI001A91F42D|nr:GNAT family N-acetyltransferase [Clostridium botulinum]MBO0530020.1 N-acetyltransferase [Clostridium botulinum]MBO0532990.1 N-acetyltransferase [Clostridium botulinum]MBO0542827.1 N-acetyltransferase [Clostridium botulinum]MBO0544434.1 N-acetyltransferase [Clostridium botulinum]MBO0553685.1 N-acetyltransferase [Clostridium botulinum]
MREDIEIYKAGISDMDKIADLIVSINEEKTKITKYDDFNFYHSKNSLEEVLNGKNKNEIIFIARNKENFIGMINLSFRDSDYLFFIDKFLYIKYLYVDKNKFTDIKEYKDASKKLFEASISEAKKHGFKYICGDVLSEEEELRELFEVNDMKNYKNRLYKKINTM